MQSNLQKSPSKINIIGLCHESFAPALFEKIRRRTARPHGARSCPQCLDSIGAAAARLRTRAASRAAAQRWRWSTDRESSLVACALT